MAEGSSLSFFSQDEQKLIAFAQPRIRAAVGGIDEAAHLAIARRGKPGGKTATVVEADPGIFRHVWFWFYELCQTRQIEGMSGLHQPISNMEIMAWSWLKNEPIAAHEYRLLRALDQIFVREERLAAAQKSKNKPDKDPSPKSKGRLAYSS